MTAAEAKRILQPDTTFGTLAEIQNYGGFSGKNAKHKPNKPISIEISDFMGWFSGEDPNEYEKGIVVGLHIARTIAKIVERNSEEDE